MEASVHSSFSQKVSIPRYMVSSIIVQHHLSDSSTRIFIPHKANAIATTNNHNASCSCSYVEQQTTSINLLFEGTFSANRAGKTEIFPFRNTSSRIRTEEKPHLSEQQRSVNTTHVSISIPVDKSMDDRKINDEQSEGRTIHFT